MSDALEKAEAAAKEAAVDTAAVQLAFAAMELAKLAQPQPTAQPHTCQHQHRPGRSTGEWIGISCAVCIGSIGIAFASIAIAIAIGGISVAILALVLRSMWRDFHKTR
ncbi:hypothetical protein ACI2L1_12100 [Streptomyces sp. NPDC019531]|uniref:hypothetical protein n=1 Tax=Streptomyces sp. NPDC019531 TaxID=3365062 RepID=UPI00384DDFA6